MFLTRKTFFWGVLLVQVQYFWTGIRYGHGILHKKGKRVEIKSQKIWR